jgi:hypothetical protein
VDDRVCPVDHLELLVVPGGSLGALVLAVPDLNRLAAQSAGGVGGVEDELDHLPVALVLVVEVVEGVEEPVLQGELARNDRVGCHVGVDRRLGSRGDAPAPTFVATSWVERGAGKIQVVLVEPTAEIGRRRPDPDQIAPRPGPAQRDRRLAEQPIHVEWPVGLAVAALLVLFDEPDDRCVPLGEGRFVTGVRGGDGDSDQREEERQEDSESSTAHAACCSAYGSARAFSTQAS